MQIYEDDADDLFPEILAMCHTLPPVVEVVKMNSKKAKFSYEIKFKDWYAVRRQIFALKLIQVYARGAGNIAVSCGYEIRALYDVYKDRDCQKIVYLYLNCKKALPDVQTLRRILRFIGFTGWFLVSTVANLQQTE